MSTFSTVYATVQLAVVSLLIHSRVLTMAFALALVGATLILGGDVAEAKRACPPGGPLR